MIKELTDNEKKYKQLITDAHTILLNLGNENVRYFGYISYGIPKRIINENDPASKTCLGYFDGKEIVYVASEVTNKTIFDIIFITIHEVLHAISFHINRRKGRDPILYNLACDHVVNRVLWELKDSASRYKNSNSYIYWLDGAFFLQDLHKNEPSINVEKVYEYIVKEKNRFKYEIKEAGQESSSSSGGSSDSNEDGNQEGNSNNQSGSKYKYVEVTDTLTGKKYITSLDTDPPPGTSQADVDESNKKYEELKDSAASLWNSQAMQKGDVSSFFKQIFDEMFKVKLPWDVILENAIMYNSQNKQDVSWAWPNEVIRYPRLPGPYSSQAPNTLVAGIDTSASIQDTDLKKFLGVICSAGEYYEQIILYVHDVFVHDTIIIDDTSSEEAIFQKIKEPRGRGGTSHKYVFDKIEEIKDSVLLSSVIFLTDFYSDVQYICKNYDFMKENQTIWALVQNNSRVDLGTEFDTMTICIDSLD